MQSQLVVIVESRQRTTDGSDLQGAADISAERGHGHMFIGAGLAAVSRSRAARHPERHAGQEAITAATLSEALARVWTIWHVGHGVFWVAAASRARVRARATFRHERTHQFSERVRHSAS